jgi:DNA repair exonuclease SbcCD ATPase subunit
MILRGLLVEHWRCIARLELVGLPAGIVILHGPNRTGKSSLVKALRGCLFDLDHDTTRADLKNSMPWNGGGPPKVAVEFETGQALYRLTKVFAKTKEGLAKLEQKREGHWRVVEDAPKEAARKARDLLGAVSSTTGLNQLLWLDQGEIALPEASKLDGSLERRLVSVLGAMVTGRDLAFKQALDKRCDRWFGIKGNHKPTSPVHGWTKRKEELQKSLADEQAKFRDVEQAIRDLEDCEARLPDLERAVHRTEQELAALKNEQAQSLRRRQQHEQAVREFKAAQGVVQTARARLEVYQEAEGRWRAAEDDAVRAEASLHVTREERDRLAAVRDQKASALQDARRAEETHQSSWEEIEDRRRLLNLTGRRGGLEETLKRARDLQAAISTLDVEIRDTLAPEEAALGQLRENRRESAKLRARFQAEALTLAVQVAQPAQLLLSLDGRPGQAVALPPDEPRTWSLRQRVRLEIAGVGIIEVARNQEDALLEQSVRRLQELDRDYRDAILALQEQPEDEACLDRLAERRVKREASVEKLSAARRDLQAVAPYGLGALESEHARLEAQRQVLLRRRPNLASWEPSEEDAREQERLFKAQARVLQNARKALEDAEKQAAQRVEKAEDQLLRCRDKAIAAKTTATNARQELGRLGDEASLQAAVKQAEAVLASAQRCLDEAQLTEAEKTVEARCQAAESALRLKQERWQQVKDDLNRHRGRLEGSEGLHTRLADVESALRETEEALAREILEAEAHKHLRDLFEQGRDHQVQQVMGPIGGRVLEWARSLGLGEFQGVRFGDRFLPEGLVLQQGAPDRTLTFADESYGTAEQLSLLVRLALGGVLARGEPVVALLDDPLAHADAAKHRRVLDVLRRAAEGDAGSTPPAGCLQILILTCHPDRFDHLPGAHHIDLAQHICRGP